VVPWSPNGAVPETDLVQVFGTRAADGLTIEQILNEGDWILGESPARGLDPAEALRDLEKVGKQARAASVQVGRFSATLILQDPSDPAGVRPFGLYWSDGGRDMYIRAAAPSNHLVDFARTFYC
jgi:hypothetical protein